MLITLLGNELFMVCVILFRAGQ